MQQKTFQSENSNRQKVAKAIFISIAIAIGVGVVALPFTGDVYYMKLMTRIFIFALLAVSLDLVVGYAGVVSLGHAAFFGVGAYLTGILAQHGYIHAAIVWPAAMIVAGLFALVIGAVSLRSHGIYLIFVTLAFAQMLFYVVQSLRQYGGDDGFPLKASSILWGKVHTGNPVTLYIAALCCLIVTIFVFHRIVRARLGRAIMAARDNEVRSVSIGIEPYPYRLAAFTIAGSFAGLAGALMANLTGYVSPALMTWIVSGDLLVMVVLGSAATIFGPVIGAAIFIVLEQVLSDLTSHWMAVLGPLLILRVLFFKEGVYGWVRKTIGA